MIHTMRWFGPKDPVPLMHIRQAGCTGIVSALHQIPVGEIWTREAIRERIQMIEGENQVYSELKWLVVESLPVHESIKKGLPEREKFIQNYLESLENLAAEGIFTVCYNFMPVLDWSRTNLHYQLEDGSEGLMFDMVDFALFDLFILKRVSAKKDYPEHLFQLAKERLAVYSAEELEKLSRTVLLGLPGSEEAFELSSFQNLLDEYQSIGAKELKENLFYFIRKIAPTAEKLGIKLCIHPDDPPLPLLGLPRVVSTEKDLQDLMEVYDNRCHGITFCAGSLGVRPDNTIPELFKKFADRIHFLHLRTTKRLSLDPLVFYEARHLEGDVEMAELVKLIILEEKKRGNDFIPMRPDHGLKILDDFNKKTYPGYSGIGRLKGLAEIRGIEIGIKSLMK